MFYFHVRRDSLEDFLDGKKKELILRKKGFSMVGSSLMKVFEQELTQKEANETCRQGFETLGYLMR